MLDQTLVGHKIGHLRMEQIEIEQLKNTMVEANKNRPAVPLEGDLVHSFSLSSSSVPAISSGSSLMESDSSEEVTSPASSAADPLSDMSSLFQQLPIKRGLSEHYQGKSQSFTSLANVTSLEDLAKAENPYNKKFKYCRNYGGGLGNSHKVGCRNPYAVARPMSFKRGLHSNSRGSCSTSLKEKRGSAGRAPIPPHGSTGTRRCTFSNQTALFA